MKRYEIKVYDKSGAYLSTWNENINKISFNNEINTAGGELKLKLARNAGDYGEGSDVDFGLRVKVYCFDKEQSDGVVIFQGYISSYTPIYKDNVVDITVLSFGATLNDYILQNTVDLPNSDLKENYNIVGIEAPNYVAYGGFGGDLDTDTEWGRNIGVKFTAPANLDNIVRIDACFHHIITVTEPSNTDLPYDVTLTLYPLLTSGSRSGYPDLDNPLGSKTLVAGTSPDRILNYKTLYYNARYADPLVYAFIFDTPIEVTPSVDYVFVLSSPTCPIIYDIYSDEYRGEYLTEWYISKTNYYADIYGSGNTSSIWPVFADAPNVAQNFMSTKDTYMTRAQFYFKKIGSPSGNITAQLYAVNGNISSGFPTGTALATSTTVINATSVTTSNAFYDFYFDGSFMLKAGTVYAISLRFANGDGSNFLYMATDNTSPTHQGNISYYTGGAWIRDDGASVDLIFNVTGADIITTNQTYLNGYWEGLADEFYTNYSVLPYAVYKGDGSTIVDYLSQDPADILIDVVDKYKYLGGQLVLNDGASTGTTVSYTFNTNTILEAINKCLELAPKNWYWYLDYSTNQINFKEKPDEPNHLFSLDNDLIDAQFEKRIEDIVNCVYFTGGDIGGGVNLYKKFVNQDSINKYGLRAIKYTDNRVTLDATAETIANSILETKSEPELRVTLTVLDSNNESGKGYDIESVQVGDVVAVRNVTQQVGLSSWDSARYDESYWDFNIYNLSSIEMQIQKIDYNEDRLIIQASTMPVDINKRIEDINRQLETIQVQNNPIAPS